MTNTTRLLFAAACRAQRIAQLEEQRTRQAAEISGLQAVAAEFAELKRETARLAKLVDQQRSGTQATAMGLE